MTTSIITATILIVATVWLIVFIWWICEDLNVKEKVMFSILACILTDLPVFIALLC